MDANTLGLLALLLACPIAMLLMMRGSHGQGGSGHMTHGDNLRHMSDEQLRETARRAEQELSEREQSRARRSDG